jgi:hypothetical protein
MKKMTLIAVVCACVATPALANLTYDMGSASLRFTESTGQLLVRETNLSQLALEFDTPGGVALDNAAITGGANFNLAVDLTLTQLAANLWTAAGTLTFTDTATGTNAIAASIASTSIVATGTSLEIRGALGPLTGTSILVNRGDPWVFAGNADDGSPANADGVANQITVLAPASYDAGDILTLKFGYQGTVDGFFGQNEVLSGGEVKGAIVPVPAAILLGFLGLGAAGLKLRRYV